MSHGISKSRVAWNRVDFVEDGVIVARFLSSIEYVLFEMVYADFSTLLLISCQSSVGFPHLDFLHLFVMTCQSCTEFSSSSPVIPWLIFVVLDILSFGLYPSDLRFLHYSLDMFPCGYKFCFRV
jgi:hypothetical protein